MSPFEQDFQELRKNMFTYLDKGSKLTNEQLAWLLCDFTESFKYAWRVKHNKKETPFLADCMEEVCKIIYKPLTANRLKNIRDLRNNLVHFPHRRKKYLNNLKEMKEEYFELIKVITGTMNKYFEAEVEAVTVGSKTTKTNFFGKEN